MRSRIRLGEVSLAPYVGHPPAPPSPDPERSRPLARTTPVPPRRGWPRPGGGRAAIMPPVPVHRGSTAQVQGLYPWLHGGSLPAAGAYVGVDCLTGGSFCCHPLAWLATGLTSNPNVVITGLPGAGKSATIKALALRLMPYGVRTFVAGDLKNEYAALARALGTQPIELGPGLPGRLNPLDAGPLGESLPVDEAALAERLAEIHRRRLVLVCSLAAMRLGRPLSPTEEQAVSLAIEEASGRPAQRPEGGGAGSLRGGALGASPTIPQVWAALRDPTADMARELRIPGDSVTGLREMTRPVTDALGGMVRGALAGLFDGPTTVSPDFGAPIQTVDLSRMADRGDEVVAMILACVSSWAQAAIDAPGPARMIVRDELWRSLSHPRAGPQGRLRPAAIPRPGHHPGAGHPPAQRLRGSRPGRVAGGSDRLQPDRVLRHQGVPAAGHRAAGPDPRADRADRRRVRPHRVLVRPARRPRGVEGRPVRLRRRAARPHPGRAAAVLHERAIWGSDAAPAPTWRRTRQRD